MGTEKNQPKVHREPRHITTVKGDMFRVDGEERLYDDPIDAIHRARKLRNGSNVCRLSDGKVIAYGPNGFEPSAPKEWT